MVVIWGCRTRRVGRVRRSRGIVRSLGTLRDALEVTVGSGEEKALLEVDGDGGACSGGKGYGGYEEERGRSDG